MNSTELVLPKDRPVDFRIKTADVIHSFWVPEFRLKSDAVPGLTTKIRLTPDRIGRYQVVCAELCGIGHATMRQNVRVVAPEAVRRVARGAARAGGGRGRRRRRRRRRRGRRQRRARRRGDLHRQRLRQLPHARAANASGTVGPDLDSISKPNAAYIRDSIVDPNNALAQGFPADIMPADFGDKLSPDELDALVEYLLKAQR